MRRLMLRLPRILLAAPALLALACNIEIGATATASDTSTGDNTTTTGEPPAPTSEGPGTSSSTTDPDATTTDATTTNTPTTTEGTTGPGAVVCMVTGECAEGEFCHAPWDARAEAVGEFTCQAECVADKGAGNSADVWCGDDDACCTAGAACDEMGYCVAGLPETTGDTGTETDTSGTDTSGTDTDDTDGTTGSTGSTGSTGDTDTGGGLLPLISLGGLEVTANCQPAVPPDPIKAKWTATFDNKAGAAEVMAEATGASLIFSPGNDEFVQGITVTPTSSGAVAPGQTANVAMTKTVALVDLPMDCEQCGKSVALEVVFDVDGQDITATADATLECVF